jgi:predicted helicase
LNTSTEALSGSFTPLAPTEPFLLFVPTSAAREVEWRLFAGLTDVFIKNSAGIITARDGLVIGRDRAVLAGRMDKFRRASGTDDEIYEEFDFSSSKRFNLHEAQGELLHVKNLDSYIRPILHRPFDNRFLFFHPSVVWSMSRPMASLMIEEGNVALLATRQVTGQNFNHAFVSRNMIEIKACSHDRNTQIFPLWLAAPTGKLSFASQEANMAMTVLSQFSEVLEADVEGLGPKYQPFQLEAADLFAYIYAVLYCPGYRLRYFELLRSEFPRIPLIASRTLFFSLVDFGNQLIELHLLDPSSESNQENLYKGPIGPTVSKLSYSAETVWIDKEETAGFRKVPEVVWEFRVGGYQVCEKWLKDRKGLVLSKEDILHYCKIVKSISNTISVMQSIDALIEAHGGWPGAFA